MTNQRVNLKRRPFLTPILLTAWFALLAFGCFSLLVWLWGTADSTTVLVAADPTSTAAAEAQSAALAKVFGSISGPGRVDAVYFAAPPQHLSAYATLLTAVGSAAHLASPDDVGALARRALHEHRGGRVLIIGERATQGFIVERLSGQRAVPVSGEDAAILYVISVPRIGQANLLRLNY